LHIHFLPPFRFIYDYSKKIGKRLGEIELGFDGVVGGLHPNANDLSPSLIKKPSSKQEIYS